MNGRPRPIPPILFLGAVVASIGGPLALVALYIPGAAGDAISSSGLVVTLALVVFVAPLGIWLLYSRRIVSSGGLAAFVEAAAGRRVAQMQALVWAVSYFLYLPYTITYVVYDIVAVVFPGTRPYHASLELILPVAIVLLVLAPVALVLVLLSIGALLQLVLSVYLGGLMFGKAPAGASPFSVHAGASTTSSGIGAIALLFVCASLPLFFGAEVRGGSRIIRSGLGAAYGLVAAVLLFASIPLAAVPAPLRGADLPGVAIAQAYSGRALADTVALVGAVSVTSLIVLEFLALGRLSQWLFGTRLRPTLAAIGVPFVVADAFSLINPDGFYSELLRPSLIALFLSQLIVVAVFPLFALRRHRRWLSGLTAVALAALAAALFGYGLYTAIANSGGS